MMDEHKAMSEARLADLAARHTLNDDFGLQLCVWCHEPTNDPHELNSTEWPCDAARAVAEVRRLEALIEANFVDNRVSGGAVTLEQFRGWCDA
jgi:hypothetical protein